MTSSSKKTCSIVFVLKWKNGAAHARVCLQGFKHEDSNTKLLNKESPTMSRIGRSFIFLVFVHKRWKAFAADAADVFLQGMNVEDLGIDIFTDLVGDVRKRLQRLMNLAADEVLKMLKSGFGDVRALRLWYDKGAKDLCQIGFVRHPLDRCVFMSFKGVDLPKSVSEGMERLDGILGLHVDDFVGGGDGLSHVAVKGWNHVPVGVPSFASRVKWLKTKLELGSIDLCLSFPFTGIQLTQSANCESIHLSLEHYLQKVKPIALSKERRQNPHPETTAQEKHQLRGLNGSMNWQVTQLMLYGAASLSIQAANVEKSIVEDMHEAKKTLRFLKANAAVGLTYVRYENLSELLLGTYFDGSWATPRFNPCTRCWICTIMVCRRSRESQRHGWTRNKDVMLVKKWCTPSCFHSSHCSYTLDTSPLQWVEPTRSFHLCTAALKSLCSAEQKHEMCFVSQHPQTLPTRTFKSHSFASCTVVHVAFQ